MRKLFWLLALALSASADVIRLRDGTTHDGEIVAETETTLSIEVPMARGTIIKTHVVPKTNVAEFTRWTAEQKKVLAMQRDYEALQKFVLDPDVSNPLGFYDPVIAAQQRFLQSYPDSSRSLDVSNQLAAWQAERSQVAAGLTKIDGEWLTKDETAKLDGISRAEFLMKRGNTALAAKQWGRAVSYYDAVVALQPGGLKEAAASRLAVEAMTNWRPELAAQVQRLEAELTATQARYDQIKNTPKPSLQFNQGNSDGKLGGGATLQAEVAVSAARLKELRPQIEKLRVQLADVNRRLAKPAPATPAAAQTPPPSGDVLQATSAWWQEYWMVFVGVGLVALWLLSRIINR